MKTVIAAHIMMGSWWFFAVKVPGEKIMITPCCRALHDALVPAHCCRLGARRPAVLCCSGSFLEQNRLDLLMLQQRINQVGGVSIQADGSEDVQGAHV